MKVIVFDFYDKDRQKPVEVKMKDSTIKKNKVFKKDDVSYRVTKVFKKPGFDRKCVEIKMVAYKIANTVTKFAHKCPAKKGVMEKMTQESHKLLEEKYGKKTVSAWKKGTVKLKVGHLSSICPNCGCVFWKEKNEKPEGFNIISLKGKKRLKKRK